MTTIWIQSPTGRFPECQKSYYEPVKSTMVPLPKSQGIVKGGKIVGITKSDGTTSPYP